MKLRELIYLSLLEVIMDMQAMEKSAFWKLLVVIIVQQQFIN